MSSVLYEMPFQNSIYFVADKYDKANIFFVKVCFFKTITETFVIPLTSPGKCEVAHFKSTNPFYIGESVEAASQISEFNTTLMSWKRQWLGPYGLQGVTYNSKLIFSLIDT